MTLHDALHERQTDACSLIVLGEVQSLKDSKQLVDIAHVEADAVVADPIHSLGPRSPHDQYQSGLPRAGGSISARSTASRRTPAASATGQPGTQVARRW